MLKFSTLFFCALLISCGGGGGSGIDNSTNVTPSVATSSTASCSVTTQSGPFTEVWPGLSWETATPESQGMCPDNISEAMDYAFEEGNFTGAVIVIRNGFIVAERYADDRLATDAEVFFGVWLFTPVTALPGR